MHPRHAGSAMERLWADEVRRLHSLWHRGPPRPKPSAAAAAGLGPSSSTPFKRAEKRRKRKEEKMQRRAAKRLAEQLSVCPEEAPRRSDRVEDASASASPSEIEWPWQPSPVAIPDAGWGDASQKPAPSSAPVPPVSQEVQERAAAMRAQQRALRACQGFLSRGDSSDDEEEDDQMDGAGDGAGGSEGSGYFNFFLNLFEEDGELRAYYEKNWEKGAFCCLVCEGIGVKMGKRFVDCVALLQHSSSIKKTKRKEAHRAFGRAICRVLGWDITRLPSIVLDMGETLGQTLVKATGLQDEVSKQSDETPVDATEVGRTDCDDCSNYLEVDDGPERPMDGVPKESDEILMDIPQAGGTAHDSCGNCVETDDNPERLMDGVPKESDEILMDIPQAGGTAHDGCGNCVETDDNPERLMDGIPKESDEILMDVPQDGGTVHDNCSSYLETDDIPETLMERPSSEVPLPMSPLEAGWGDSEHMLPPLVWALPASEEEQEMLATVQVHKKALRACQDFFSQQGSLDIEEEDEEEDGLMDEDEDGKEGSDGGMGGEDQEGSRYFKFFLGLFEEDEDLRAYYEKNWGKGEFCCLVCEGIRVKVRNRFNDCVALVRHSSSIAKTKRRDTHRAFGRAICHVLGWDITRLPSIVLDTGGTLEQTLTKATDLQDDIPNQGDDILVYGHQADGGHHDNHSIYLEADGNKEQLMEAAGVSQLK